MNSSLPALIVLGTPNVSNPAPFAASVAEVALVHVTAAVVALVELADDEASETTAEAELDVAAEELADSDALDDLAADPHPASISDNATAAAVAAIVFFI